MVSKKGTHGLRAAAYALGALLGAAAPMSPAFGHGTEARFVEFLDWKKEQLHAGSSPPTARIWKVCRATGPKRRRRSSPSRVARASSGSSSRSMSTTSTASTSMSRWKLSLTYAAEYTTPFLVGYDKSGGSGVGLHEVAPNKGEKFPTLKLTLDRARFAGQATQGADIAMAAPDLGAMVVCDIKVDAQQQDHRSHRIRHVQTHVERCEDRWPGAGAYRALRLDRATRRSRPTRRSCCNASRTICACWRSTIAPSGRRRTARPSTPMAPTKAGCPVGTYDLVVDARHRVSVPQGKVEVQARTARRTWRWSEALRRHARRGLVLGRFAHPRDTR